MGVDVDQARNDELAACIDRLRCIPVNIRLDRRDPAAGYRDVADRVQFL